MKAVTYSQDPGTLFPIGTTVVTATATDPAGNSDVCTFNVTVTDDGDPVITCPANQTRSNDDGVCTYTAVGLEFNPTSFYDNCSSSTISNDLNGSPTLAGYVFLLGTTTVTWTVTDTAGNTAACSFTVTVNDDEGPTVTCPADITQEADEGECYATISELGNPVTGDNCGVASVTNDAPVDDHYPVGPNIVTWTIEDESGNTTTCEQTITVTDDEPPTIIDCPEDITVYTGPGSTICGQVATWVGPTAVDNCPGAVSLTSSHPPGSTFPVGTTTVTYTATDISGNQSFCYFDVTVIDNTPPDFTKPLDLTIYVNALCGYNAGTGITGDATGEYDNCLPIGEATYTDSVVSVTCPPIFLIYRKWSLTDIHGNTTIKTQLITVADILPPNYNEPFPPNISIQCHITADPLITGEPSAYDNCGGPVILTYSDDTIGLPCPTEYNIHRTWSATDCSGNTRTNSHYIFVRDDIAPTILSIDHDTVLCPADIPPPDISVIHAVDNCAFDSVIFQNEIPFGLDDVPGYCPDSVHRIYRVKDECGNFYDAVQRIIVLSQCDCSPCADTLSFYMVDMYGDPYADTTLYDVERLDKCCDATKDYCVAFNIRLDDDAVGVQITIDGSSPSPHDWRIDCEEVEIIGDIICIPGGIFHLFTYCKPGGNKNDFRFQSIAAVVAVGELTTRVSCNTELFVEGILTDPVWTSVYPDDVGDYDFYLSCTNCPNPIFTPDEFSPPEIQYQVCAGIAAGPCNESGFGCDTIIIHVLDSIHIEFDVDPDAYCYDDIPEICATVFPEGTYSYAWYDHYDSTGTLVGTEPCYQPVLPGPYSLVVKSLLEDVLCSSYLFNFDVAPDNDPPIVHPPEPDSLILACADPNNPQLIQDWLATAWAEDLDGNPPNPYVYHDYTGISEFCNSVVTVTFTAEDFCENIGTATCVIKIVDNQPPTITCPPDIIVEADPVTCEVEDPVIGTAIASDLCPGTVLVTNDAPDVFPRALPGSPGLLPMPA